MPRGGPKKPIQIQGQNFASMTLAAKHFGVTLTAIHHAKKRGKLDSIGIGSRHLSCRPCEVAGKKYPSLVDAAADLDVLPSEVSAFLKVAQAISKAKLNTHS